MKSEPRKGKPVARVAVKIASWAAALQAVVPAAAASTAPKTEDQQLQELWERDTSAFARCFDIADKDAIVVPYEPTALQEAVWSFLDEHKRSQFLKGRQIFCTTAVATYALKQCWLRPGFRVCLAAHDDKSAMEIGEFYAKLHAGNPYLREKMPRIDKGAHKITFANGSQILIGTANSKFWQGQPCNFAHLTEAAKYDNLGETIGDLGQCVPPSGWIVLESTANGDNSFRKYWYDKRSRFKKCFLCWLDHPEYVSDEPLPGDLLEAEIEHIKKYNLSPERASWWVQKYREMDPEMRHRVDEQYPCVPDDAFLVSGDKFLRKPVPLPPPSPIYTNGVSLLLPYDKRHQFVAGVDTASGSQQGDYSTVVILDVTARAVAATMQVRVAGPEFATIARELLRLYHDPLTVCEINTFGLSVSNYLRDQGVPQFMMIQTRGLSVTLQSSHGWMTDPATRPILQGGIFVALTGRNPWTIGCLRLASELNALQYDKKGAAHAPSGSHDDLALGFALAIQGVPQVREPEEKAPVVQRVLSAVQAEWERIVSGKFRTGRAKDDEFIPSKPRQGDFTDS